MPYAADLGTSDPDSTDAELVYTVTGSSHGTVLVSGAAASSFTQADLVAGTVSFQHDGSETTAGSFTVSLTDGLSTSQSRTINATVTPVNDDPVFVGDFAITVAEGGMVAVSAADLSASDSDSDDAQLVYTVTGTSHGTVLVSGAVASSFS